MTCTFGWLKRVLKGYTPVYQPLRPEPVTLPTIAGNAVVGDTLTASHGTYTQTVLEYQQQWLIAPDPFTNYTAISNEEALTYLQGAGDAGDKLIFGERPRGLGGWGAWSYSLPTGIVAAVSAGTLPTINAPALATPTSGLQTGDTITVSAPDIDDATHWFVTIGRDGVYNEAFATIADTFPFSYVIQPQDVCTTFTLRTWATNDVEGQTIDYSPNYGPVTAPAGTSIIDLGGPDETEAFIRLGFTGEWVKSGTATRTQTVASPSALETFWNANIKNGSPSERWEITLDWDGLAALSSGSATQLTLAGPTGATGWKDSGGWVYLKAASGKRPAFSNQVYGLNWRGVYTDGLDFAGVYVGTNWLNASKNQASLFIDHKTSYTAEAIYYSYNCRYGKSAVDGSFVYNTYCVGFTTKGTAEQVTLDTCAVAGIYAGLKYPCRRGKLINCSFSDNLEDTVKLYTQTKSGFYAYLLVDHCTFANADLGQVNGIFHQDCIQSGTGADTHLGNRILVLDTYDMMDHKYGSPTGGGGSQGMYNDDHFTADNLFCVRRSGFMGSSPHGFTMFSPEATYKSYIEDCTFGRCGLTPSLFDGDPVDKDWSPGTKPGTNPPSRSGVAFEFINCLLGNAVSVSYATYTNCVVIDYTKAQTSPTPEDVFNGADFDRGGPDANNIANKFAYYFSNQATQQGFLDDWIANLVAQGAYSGKGAPAPVKANYTAPALG